MRIEFTAHRHDDSLAAEADAREVEAGLWREVFVRYDEQGREVAREPAAVTAEDVRRHEAFIRCVLQNAALVRGNGGILPPPRSEDQLQADRIEKGVQAVVNAILHSHDDRQGPSVSELDKKRAASALSRSRARTREILTEMGFDLTKVRP